MFLSDTPYIFILVVELLSSRIKKEKDIKGLQLGNLTFLINQYADDTFLLLDGSEKSLRKSMEIINMFGSISGLYLNISKSKAIWLGSKAGSTDKICEDLNISWTNENFKPLGIKFTNNLNNMIEINYNEKLQSLRKLLGSWTKRDLTPIGKITIIKSLAIPKLIHLFSSLPNAGKSIINEFEKVFYKFIWSGKPDKIKRLTHKISM